MTEKKGGEGRKTAVGGMPEPASAGHIFEKETT